MSITRFKFSTHATQRWSERCSNYIFSDEMSRLKKVKLPDQKKGRSAYRTKSGLILIVFKGIVVTVFSGREK